MNFDTVQNSLQYGADYNTVVYGKEISTVFKGISCRGTNQISLVNGEKNNRKSAWGRGGQSCPRPGKILISPEI